MILVSYCKITLMLAGVSTSVLITSGFKSTLMIGEFEIRGTCHTSGTCQDGSRRVHEEIFHKAALK